MNLNDRLIRIQRSEEGLEDISANRLQSLVKKGERVRPEQEDSILKKKIIDNLVQDLAADLDIKQLDEREIYQVAKRVEEITDQVMNQEGKYASRAERHKIIEDILDEIIGLGPLEPLLKDPDITEIMVNSPTNIYIEREGKISRAGIAFRDNGHIMQVIDKIVSPLGRRIDESSPMVDTPILQYFLRYLPEVFPINQGLFSRLCHGR